MKFKKASWVLVGFAMFCVAFWLCQDRVVGRVDDLPSNKAHAVLPQAEPAKAAAKRGSLSAVPTNQTATVRGTKPYVLRCENGFRQSLRVAAEALGVRTVDVLSEKELLVEADAAARVRLTADGRFSSVREFLPSAKIAEDLLAMIRGGAESVEVALVTLSPADHQAVQDRVVSCGGEILKGCFNEGDTFRARLPASIVSDLAACGDVRWMEVFVRPQVMNDVAVEPKAMNVRPLWLSDENPFGLSGAGQIISTSDSGIDTGDEDPEKMHPDLVDQICGMNFVDGCAHHDAIGHGTHTAGSIVGSGAMSDGRIRGTAWGAKIFAWFCGKDGDRGIYTPETVEELFQPDQENSPAYIHSGSWGSSQAGAYTTQCVDMDKFVWEHPDFLPVFSAGNDGSSGGTIGSPASAKNILTVGATQNLRMEGGKTSKNGNPKETADYSSRGPCKDGRIKPDIAAPGTGVLSTRAHGMNYSYGNYNEFYAYDTGTSMACPLTAGAVALVREWLVKHQGFEDTDDTRPTAALMKAVITGGAKDAETPGNDQGWGRVDLQETLDPSDRAVKLFDRLPFADGEEFAWVVETTNDAPFDVQLAWVDYPGSASTPQGERKLVNDLDLTVESLDSASAEIFYGNGGEDPDFVNNVESVRIASGKAGRYLVRVDCRNVLYDWHNGGAAALYVRGAFDPDETFTEPEITRIRETETFYSSLDRALEAAEDGQTIEILQPVRLTKNVVLGKSVTITATNENAFASAITRVKGATLTVTNGIAFFTNVVFTTEGTTPVRAAADGAVQVAGVAVFDDLCSGVPGIVTETDHGFILGGELLNGLTLSCTAAMADGAVFGSYVCDYATAMLSAVRVASLEREDRLGQAVDPGEGLGDLLVWKDGSTIGPDVAAASATVDGETSYYRSLASLLKAYPTDPEMTVTLMRAKATLDRAISIAGRSLSIESSFNPATTVTIDGRGSVFTVGENGALSVKGVVFGGDVDRTFILVKDGGECTLGEGAAVRGLTCKFSDPVGKAYGPIAVTKGTFTMLAGSEISGCRAEGATQANLGGGVYLNGAGCELVLDGGAIFDCHAKKFGGGVYAHNKSVIRVSGAAKVCGNSSDNFAKDDIYLADSSCALIVAGDVAGGDLGVRYAATCASGNKKGEAFARTEGGATVEGVSFVNDLDETLMAAANGDSLVWADRPTGPRPLSEAERDRAVVATVIGSKTNYYAVAEEAFEALDASGDILVLKDAEFGTDLIVKFPVTLRASEVLHPFEDDTPWSLVRRQDCSLVVGEGISLTMTNVTVRCAMDDPSSAALIDVHGARAELFLKDGATVCDVFGGYNRASCGIKVWNDATVTMESGSLIVNCDNRFANPGDDAGCGGGLLVDHATAYLHGGEISGCSAFTGGGMCLANESTAYVSGDMTIDGNTDLDWFVSNLVVQDHSNLVLDGELQGVINCHEGYQHSNPAVIGTVDENVSDEIAAESAHNFIHDTDGDIGMLVKGDGKRLLVWSNAIAADGTFVDGTGATYELTDAAPVAIPVPWPEFGLVYDGEEKEGVLEDFGFTLEGNLATNAGTYTATATLKKGFIWDDETSDPKPIEWNIEKAVYDMSGVVFKGATVTYDGEVHSLAVKDGTLPEGVTVEYENNDQVNVGEYEVVAKFSGDAENYEPIDDMTATLVIAKATYDMSAIVFHDVEYSETGKPLAIQIEGALPEGVTVEYVYEGPDPEHAAPGVYTVTAKFTGDADNYEPIADMTATMTIVESQFKEQDDPPGPTPIEVPQPINITSLKQGADGTWTIVVNPVAKFCKYTLYASDDLESWDQVGEPVISDVDADLTFTRSETDPKKFWKVVGENGEKPAE